MVGEMRIESAYASLQSPMLIERRERAFAVQAIDVVEILHIGSEVTPSQVAGSRKAEIVNLIGSRQRRIHILLMIPVVGMNRDVLRIIRTVVQEIVCVFQYRPDAYRMQIFR